MFDDACKLICKLTDISFVRLNGPQRWNPGCLVDETPRDAQTSPRQSPLKQHRCWDLWVQDMYLHSPQPPQKELIVYVDTAVSEKCVSKLIFKRYIASGWNVSRRKGLGLWNDGLKRPWKRRNGTWWLQNRFLNVLLFWLNLTDLVTAGPTETRSHRKTLTALKQRFLSKGRGCWSQGWNAMFTKKYIRTENCKRGWWCKE